MIKELVARWEANKEYVRDALKLQHPDNYKDLVWLVIKNITADDYEDFALDPERIHEIDDGDYQGTLLYIIAEKGYQPSRYYSVFVDYGSCSGCDTLEGIREYSSDPPTGEQIDQYMTLALHIVQGIKVVGEPS